ncbi:hypothetical protein BJV78DRAFT_1196631 [Lactifluus subvellereus]|nr:hypothetical protein BJV78DRAFT_1196631 [Lactifluus subvellereus]
MSANPDIEMCWESLVGDTHFQMFRMKAPNVNTGACSFTCVRSERLFNPLSVVLIVSMFNSVSEEENLYDSRNVCSSAIFLACCDRARAPLADLTALFCVQ